MTRLNLLLSFRSVLVALCRQVTLVSHAPRPSLSLASARNLPLIIHHVSSLLAAPAAVRLISVLLMSKGAMTVFGRLLAHGAQVTVAPGETSVYQWLSPHGEILIEASSITGLVTVLAEQDACDDDRIAANDVLSFIGTAPLGEPEFLDEFDVWTTLATRAEALAAA